MIERYTRSENPETRLTVKRGIIVVAVVGLVIGLIFAYQTIGGIMMRKFMAAGGLPPAGGPEVCGASGQPETDSCGVAPEDPGPVCSWAGSIDYRL